VVKASKPKSRSILTLSKNFPKRRRSMQKVVLTVTPTKQVNQMMQLNRAKVIKAHSTEAFPTSHITLQTPAASQRITNQKVN
jgi:uncharacterized membrane protein